MGRRRGKRAFDQQNISFIMHMRVKKKIFHLLSAASLNTLKISSLGEKIYDNKNNTKTT